MKPLKGPLSSVFACVLLCVAAVSTSGCSAPEEEDDTTAGGAAISGTGGEGEAVALEFPSGLKNENGTLLAGTTTFTFDLKAKTAARIVLNGTGAESVHYVFDGSEGTGSILWFYNATSSAKSYSVDLTTTGDQISWIAAMSAVAPDSDITTNTWACAIATSACTYQGFDPATPDSPPRLKGVCKQDANSVLVDKGKVGRCVAK